MTSLVNLKIKWKINLTNWNKITSIAVNKNASCSSDKATLRLKELWRIHNIQVSLISYTTLSNSKLSLTNLDLQALTEKKSCLISAKKQWWSQPNSSLEMFQMNSICSKHLPKNKSKSSRAKEMKSRLKLNLRLLPSRINSGKMRWRRLKFQQENRLVEKKSRKWWTKNKRMRLSSVRRCQISRRISKDNLRKLRQRWLILKTTKKNFRDRSSSLNPSSTKIKLYLTRRLNSLKRLSKIAANGKKNFLLSLETPRRIS